MGLDKSVTENYIIAMPFKSEAQRRKFYAMEASGEIPKGTVAKWEAHTPDRKLPEHVKSAALLDLFRKTKAAVPKTSKPLFEPVAKPKTSDWDAYAKRLRENHWLHTAEPVPTPSATN